MQISMHQSKSRPNKRKSQPSSGVVRIIGGTMRGRKIRFASGEGLRPTMDRIRETVFNWLAGEIAGKNCLDLFSGSGALGFEAASRGAASIHFIEKSKDAAQSLKENCKLLSLGNAKVHQGEAMTFLERNSEKFDLVFLDPPFGKNLLAPAFEKLQPHLSDDALIYIEQESSDSEFLPPKPWTQLKYKSTGSFSYGLYSKLSSD